MNKRDEIYTKIEDDPTLTKTKCPLCGNTLFDFISNYQGRTKIFKQKAVVSCAQCHFVFMNPVPSWDDLSCYYNHGTYWGHVIDKTPFDIPTFHHQAKARINFIVSRITLSIGSDVLDIGAGYGVLETNFQRFYGKKLNFYAVEPDKKGQQSLTSNGVHCVNEITKYTGKKFDLVILSHVLEHMNDPLGFLLSLKNYLKPTAHLFIEVPNEDFRFKYELEPHILFFNSFTLFQTLNLAGYQVVDLATCGNLIEKQRRMNWQNKIKNQLMDKLPFKSLLKSIKRFIYHDFIRPTSFENDPFSIGDIFECETYGQNRIWLRSLAKLSG